MAPGRRSLITHLRIRDHNVKTIVDTGAEVCCMNDKLAEKLGFHSNNHDTVKLQNADGSVMTSYVVRNMPFKLGNKFYQWDVYVAPISNSFILGLDFLSHHSAYINCANAMFIHRDRVPLVEHIQKTSYSVCQVKMPNKVMLDPLSVNEFPVKIDNPEPGKSYMLEPSSFERRILVASTVSRGENIITARVINLENRRVCLERKTVLGYAVEVNDADIEAWEHEGKDDSDGSADSMSGSESDGDVSQISHVSKAPQQPYFPHSSLRDEMRELRLKAVKKMAGPQVNHVSESYDRSNETLVIPDHLKKLYEDSISGLNRADANKLARLLIKYQDVFSKNDEDLGMCTEVCHRIDTGDHKPIRQPLRRTIRGMEDVEDKVIDSMLKNKVIEPSKSQWASPVVLVKKKDGGTRFCIDFRKVNAATVKDSFPLPNIEHCIDTLAGSAFFSTLDLNSGYWQVALHPQDKEKTAFISRRGLFQWSVMPFGLCNAPATFQRMMECTLRGILWTSALCYIDDVVVFGQSIDQSLDRLEAVFERLRRVNLKLKPRKCKLLATEVLFLGFIVDGKGVRVNPSLVSDVVKWPDPRNVKDLQSFLGTTSYFRKWIKGYADIASPLYELTKRRAKWVWGEREQKAFESLKQSLVNPPILSHPIPGHTFILDTDASDFALGCVLLQEQPNEQGQIEEKVIAYSSFIMDPQQRRYCTTRRELLAVVRGTRAYRHYLLNSTFLVRTDHGSLAWLMRFRDPQGQLARFLEELSCYDMVIQHRAGTKHGDCDGLSRRPSEHGECSCYTAGATLESLPCGGCAYCRRAFNDWDKFSTDVDYVTPLTAKHAAPGLVSKSLLRVSSDESPFWTGTYTLEEMRHRQMRDPDLRPVLEWKNQGSKPDFEELALESRATKCYVQNWSSLVLKKGVLHYAWIGPGAQSRLKLVVPRGLRDEAIQGCHDPRMAGHMGEQKTLQMVRERFHWYGITEDVVSYVKSCDVCNRTKKGRNPRAPMRRFHAGFFGEKVHMDVLGPFHVSDSGSKYVLIIVDNFTKFIEAYPLPEQSSYQIAQKFVYEWVSHYGVPMSVVTDQGSPFCSDMMQQICKLLECAKLRTTPYHPSANGQAERFCGVVARMIRSYTDRMQRTWDVGLSLLTSAIRRTPNRSTGFSPNRMVFGTELAMPVDIVYGTVGDELKAESHEYVKQVAERQRLVHDLARENLQASQKRNKRDYDQRVYRYWYKAGDFVYVRDKTSRKGFSKKLEHPWRGPWLVVQLVHDSDVLYELTDGKRQVVVHHDRVKPYRASVSLAMKRLKAKVLEKKDITEEIVSRDLIHDDAVDDLALDAMFGQCEVAAPSTSTNAQTEYLDVTLPSDIRKAVTTRSGRAAKPRTDSDYVFY